MGGVLAYGLAGVFRIGDGVQKVVGDLVGLAQGFAQGAPGAGIYAGGGRAGDGGGGEQGAGFGALIGGEVDFWLAFPGLAGADAVGHARGLADGDHQRRQAGGCGDGAPGQRLEGQYDECVASEHRQRRAKGGVDGRPATAGGGIVKTGQIVMHQGGAVQQLDGRGGGVCCFRVVIPAGGGDGQAQAGADARALGEHGVAHGGGEQRRAVGRLGARECEVQPGFNA